MKYVKLIAKPDTWFKTGTEVFHYDEHRRVSLDEWNKWITPSPFIILVRGHRICDSEYEKKLFDVERWDGESCGVDEFDMEIVDSDGSLEYKEAYDKLMQIK